MWMCGALLVPPQVLGTWIRAVTAHVDRRGVTLPPAPHRESMRRDQSLAARSPTSEIFIRPPLQARALSIKSPLTDGGVIKQIWATVGLTLSSS